MKFKNGSFTVFVKTFYDNLDGLDFSDKMFSLLLRVMFFVVYPILGLILIALLIHAILPVINPPAPVTTTLSLPDDICVIDGVPQIVEIDEAQLRLKYLRTDGATVIMTWRRSGDAVTPGNTTIFTGGTCPSNTGGER